MAAAAVSSLQPSDMECSVCSDFYKRPKVLRCGHLMCEGCLISWLKSKPGATCPICRYPILKNEEVESGKSFEKIIELIPTDFATINLIQAKSILSQQNTCHICENEAADSICLTCGDMFCKVCSKFHCKQTVLKNHQVVELATLTSEKLAAETPAFCDVHSQSISQLYCSTHQVSLCMLCATSDHRQCPEVMRLETKQEEVRSMLSEIHDGLDERLTYFRESMNQQDRLTEDDFALAKATHDRLESALKDCYERLKKLAQDASSDRKKKMLDKKLMCSEHEAKLTTFKKLVQRTRQFCSCGHSLSVASKLKTYIPDVILTATVPTVETGITLTIDPEVVSRIERGLSQLGQLLVVQTKLHFHHNHSKTMIISDNGRTAEGTRGSHSWVMSYDSMLTDLLYEVQVDEISTKRSHTGLGVLFMHPDTVPCLDILGWPPSPATVVVNGSYVWTFGQEEKKDLPALRDLPKGAKLGLSLLADGSLVLYVNGVLEGVVARDMPSPCYFLIGLGGQSKKVTALPVCPIPNWWLEPTYLARNM